MAIMLTELYQTAKEGARENGKGQMARGKGQMANYDAIDY
jgi:hypothetical protein